MRLTDHKWGVSPAQDRVLSQVAGLRPSLALGRGFMVLQAYIDDSVDGSDGYFVLAGYIATAEAWAAFAKDWEELLEWGTPRPSDGRLRFKMSEMALSAGGMQRVPAFFRVIEKHVLMSVSCAYRLADLERAKRRIFTPTLAIDWGMADLRYIFGWRLLMDKFHGSRDKLAEFIPLDQTIDFYFDEQSEKAEIIAAWSAYIENRSLSVRDLYGATPRFEDDMQFLPLQAADFWAWWVRKWYKDGTPEKMQTGDFGEWSIKKKPYIGLAIHYTEDQIIEGLVANIRDAVPGHQVFVIDLPPDA